MKMKNLIRLSLLAAFAAAPLSAAEKKATAMDPAMAEAMKLSAPNSHHELLKPMVGTFNATVKMWMKPGEKAQESKGTAVNTLMFGGRFLKQDYKGEFMNQPFEGVGYTGYDNIRGEYQSIWMDGMMTGIMSSAGSYNEASKTLNLSGTFSCPMTGEKNRWSRAELNIVNNDKHTYTSYGKGPDGKEAKEMEITYVRAK